MKVPIVFGWVFLFIFSNLMAQDYALITNHIPLSSIRTNFPFSNNNFLRYGSTKRPPGYKQKRVGIILASLGMVLVASSIPMLITADSYYYSVSSNGDTEGDPKGGFGSVMIALGNGILIPGSILWAKGAKKMQKPKPPPSFKM